MARTLPIETFRDYATPEVFQRGQRYYKQDAVNKFSRQGNTLTARVYGSYNYRVNVTLLERSDKPDEYDLKSAKCSCPYGDTFDGLCKHIIAVLLKFHHEGAAETVTVTKHQGGDARAKLAELSKEDLRGLLEHLFDHYPDAADVAAVFWQQQTITQQATHTKTNTSKDSMPKNKAAQPQTTPEIDTRPYCALMERAASQPDMSQGLPRYPQAHEVLENVTPLLEAAAYQDAFKLAWDLLETFINTVDNLDEDLINEMLYVDTYEEMYYDEGEGDGIAFADDDLLTKFDRVLARAALGAQASLSDDTRKAYIEKLTAWEDTIYNEFAMTEFPRTTYALGSTFHTSDKATQMYEDYAKAHLKHAQDDYHTIALLVMKDSHGEDAALEYAKQHARGLQYLTILLQRGDIDTVMGCYQDYVNTLADIWELIKQLEPRYPQEAATVADYGLDYADTLQQQDDVSSIVPFMGGISLYAFLEDIGQLAVRLEVAPLHFRAARLLFQAHPTLPTFNTLHQLVTANNWAALREELLSELRQQPKGIPSDKLDILLHEERFDDAVNFIQDRHPAAVDMKDVWRVMDAVVKTHSPWVIKRGSKHAEKLVAETKSSHYRDAVTSLGYVKKAYLAADQREQWQTYAEELAETHKRKRKFMALFEGLL